MGNSPKLAMIGLGNMGEALLAGIVEKKVFDSTEITGAETFGERADYIASEYGVKVYPEPSRACADADIVIIAVKPHDAAGVIKSLGDGAGGKVIISICAGLTLGTLAEAAPEGTPIVRVMPNTPALVGEGVSVYCANENVTREQLNTVQRILSAVGEAYLFEKEALIDAATGLSGSGPAYAATFIEALTDAGVLLGIPRDLSLKLAINTVSGTCTLLEKTGDHPAQLRDKVTSPGGTTIAAVRSLEENGFNFSVIEAVRISSEKAKEMGGK